ncbi:MAG: hypothetical protein ABJA78_18140 [Ferruginibacter sp.]
MQKMIAAIIVLIAGVGFTANINSAKDQSYGNRKTITVITNAQGEIMKAGETGVYVIHCGEKYLDLNAYNLPEKFKKDKLTVSFSGNIKLTGTLEDEWGDLFEVTDIR